MKNNVILQRRRRAVNKILSTQKGAYCSITFCFTVLKAVHNGVVFHIMFDVTSKSQT